MKVLYDDIMSNLEGVSATLEGLAKALEEAEAQGPIEFSRTFLMLRQIKDRADEVFKPVNTAYEQLKTENLPKVFELAGVPSVNLDEGFRITVSHAVRASIKGGQKEGAFEWLRTNGLEDLITETVNASTLSATAKSMAEDNEELPPEHFNVAILANTSVNPTRKGK